MSISLVSYLIGGICIGGIAVALICATKIRHIKWQHSIEIQEKDKVIYKALNALRVSGSRIRFYKEFNEKHLKTILSYKNRVDKIRDTINQPLD